MKRTVGKRLFTTLAVAAAVLAGATVGASACTTIYVGAERTEDGLPIVARSEDYVNSQNKLFYISEAGAYEGEFRGCPAYGPFVYTLSHPSYRFTAFKADNEYDGTCPECGEGSKTSPAGHPSYTEAGTNEKGVTVTATETISGNDAVEALDPYHDADYARERNRPAGIEETDIPTVLLSEAATAREGVELLLGIYDKYGCADGAGLFIADQKEIWYIENCSGTQYIALKLTPDMIFLEPNTSTIGRIDLDDTDNVLASARLIATAKQAGTFVGDEAENIIDYRASYGNLASVGSKSRLANGLNFLNSAYRYTDAQLLADNARFTVSNLNAGGKVVPLYTNIKADRSITVDDVVNYYKVDGIANTGNTDTAFFQIDPDRPLERGTVEWVSLDHGAYNVFVPYYPMLLDKTYEGYRAATPEAVFATEEPASGMYYPATSYQRGADGRYVYGADGNRISISGWKVLPQGWEQSYYWCFDALSNYLLSVDSSNEAYVKERFAALQKEIYRTFDGMNVSNASTARTVSTQTSGALAEKAHKLALELTRYVVKNALPFKDVVPGAYYVDAVKWAAEKGIAGGVSDAAFGPDRGCTRGQAAAFLYRMAGSPAAAGEGFADVPEDAFCADAVKWAAAEGITGGKADGSFAPDAVCTRGQIVTFLYRLAGSPAVTGAGFKDVPAGAYCADAVKWAATEGITGGKADGSFAPDAVCTRAQIVTFLNRYAVR